MLRAPIITQTLGPTAGSDMIIRIDVTESTMVSGTTIVKTAVNDRIDAEQHEADDQCHGKETT